jgi:hypothetical protein
MSPSFMGGKKYFSDNSYSERCGYFFRKSLKESLTNKFVNYSLLNFCLIKIRVQYISESAKKKSLKNVTKKLCSEKKH